MTSETKFTPGPWFVLTDHPTNAAVRVCSGFDGWHGGELATLYGPCEGDEDENGVWPLGETRMANARLIAAAPDLYAALVETLAIAERNESGEYADRARAALAKARGSE